MRAVRIPVTKAFSLLELITVVVIIGILAVIVTPRFTHARETASENVTLSELEKLRRIIEVHKATKGSFPALEAGGSDASWAALMSDGTLKAKPENAWVGGPNASVIQLGDRPDTAFTDAYGWIYHQPTGRVWAAGFDGLDRPLPR